MIWIKEEVSKSPTTKWDIVKMHKLIKEVTIAVDFVCQKIMYSRRCWKQIAEQKKQTDIQV